MSMRTAFNIPLIILSCIVFLVHSCYAEKAFDPLYQLLRAKRTKEWFGSSGDWESTSTDGSASPVHMSSQSGLKEADKIKILPGQPQVTFNQYSGYVTVDPKAGRALFYYFVEAPISPSTKPLLLWLNGGPGCSSFGNGAMLELGPFRVNSNGETLYANEYAWNKAANVLFLESPAGVGFSYSNTTSDYKKNGDKRTAEDTYAFLVNWLERFPEYKNRAFFISGESYAGHYVPQLAQTILRRNKSTKQTVINLRGIAIGNALIDDETTLKGSYDFFWTHAMISDEVMADINSHCNFSNLDEISPTCNSLLDKADESIGNIYIYNIYAPFCRTSSSAKQAKEGEQFDPCSQMYVSKYLNHPQVQSALHANVTALPFPWTACSSVIDRWNDAPTTVIPIIQELMASGISVWIYSGDIDGRIPVTSTRYSIKRIVTSIETPWYPWYSQGEVGGYAVGYRNMTFVTVRGAGHLVPSYQPARALTLVSSFLEGKLPPTT